MSWLATFDVTHIVRYSAQPHMSWLASLRLLPSLPARSRRSHATYSAPTYHVCHPTARDLLDTVRHLMAYDALLDTVFHPTAYDAPLDTVRHLMAYDELLDTVFHPTAHGALLDTVC